MIDLKERLKKYNQERFFGKWQLDGTVEQAFIDRGSYGSVYSVVNVQEDGSREYSAIKIIAIDETIESVAKCKTSHERQAKLEKIRDEVKNEIDIIDQLKGAPNIALFFDWEIKNRQDTDLECWDVLIWMRKLITLKQHFTQNGIQPGTPRYRLEALRLWKDIGKALNACEKNSVIHGDVKPKNILYSPEYDIYMLCDFGTSVKGKTFDKTYGWGTYPYISPEVYYRRGGDSRADMYSLAVTVYEMLTVGQLPLNKDQNDRLMMQPVPPIGQMPDDVNEALLKCLQEDPARRYASLDEVEHVATKLFIKYEEIGDVAEKAPKKKSWLLPVMAGAAALAVCVGVVSLALGSGGKDGSDEPEYVEVMAEEPAPDPAETPEPAETPTPAPTPTEAPTETPAPTHEPSPEPVPEVTEVPVMLSALSLDETSVPSDAGNVTVHGHVTVEGAADADSLRVSFNGNRAETQWQQSEDGYAFTASLEMALEDEQVLTVEVGTAGGEEPVSMALPVEAVEVIPVSTPAALAPITLAEQMDGIWIGPSGRLSVAGTAQPDSSVDFAVNGTVLGGSYIADAAGSFEADILPQSMLEGENRISLDYAQSMQAGEGFENSFSIHYDSTAPQIEVQPVIDQFVSELEVSVSDQDDSCEVSLRVDGEAVSWATAQAGTAVLTGLDTLGLTENSVIRVAAADRVGNTAEAEVTYIWQKAVITVDGQQQMEQRVYGIADAEAGITVTGQADPLSSIVMTVGAGNTTVQTDADGHYSALLDGGMLSQGDNAVSIQYIDAVDAAASFTIHYDGTAPELVLGPMYIVPGDQVSAFVSGEEGQCQITLSALDEENMAADFTDVIMGQGSYTLQIPADARGDLNGYAVAVTDQAGNTSTQYLLFLQPVVVGNAADVQGRPWGLEDTLELLLGSESMQVLVNGAAQQGVEMRDGSAFIPASVLAEGDNDIEIRYSDDGSHSANSLEQTAVHLSVFADMTPPQAQVSVSQLTRDTDELTVTLLNEERSYDVALLVNGAPELTLTGVSGQTAVLSGIRDLQLRESDEIAVTVTDNVNTPASIPLAFSNTSQMVEAYVSTPGGELGSVGLGEALPLQAMVLCDSYDMEEGYIYIRLTDGDRSVDCNISSQYMQPVQDEAQYADMIAQAAAQGVTVDEDYVNTLYQITGVVIPGSWQGGEQTVEMVFDTEHGAPTVTLGTVSISGGAGQTVEDYVNAESNYAIGLDEPVQEAFSADSIVLTGWIYSVGEPQISSYAVNYAGNSFTGYFTNEQYEQLTIFQRADAAEHAERLGLITEEMLANEELAQNCYGFVLRLDLRNNADNVAMSMADGLYSIQLISSNVTGEDWQTAQATVQISADAPAVDDRTIEGMTASWTPETPTQEPEGEQA